MDSKTKQLIEDGVATAYAGTRSFGEQVMLLSAQGVESYRVDYRERVATYFLPSGDLHRTEVKAPALEIGDAFDADALIAAIRGSQQGVVKYPEFIERSMRAGCVGYVVWIAGRQVTYFGRRGETHIERFPSKP